MDEIKAAGLYLTDNQTARAVVAKIMRWDEKGTIKDNAKLLDTTIETARRFQDRYGLEYRRLKPRSGRKVDRSRVDAYTALKEQADWTMRDIAKVFKVTRQAVEDGYWRNKKRLRRKALKKG